MKNLILILIVLSLLVGCQSNSINEKSTSKQLEVSGHLDEVKEPNDPDYMNYQYHYLKAIGYDYSVVSKHNGQGVRLGIVDSGVNRHEDLDLSSSFNLTTSNVGDIDVTGHGTFIAGLIAAKTNNNMGMAGLTPRVELISLKCFDDAMSTDIQSLVAAIEKAIDLDLDVINLSLTVEEDYDDLRHVIDKALKNGMIICAPSGNDQSGKVYYPANYPGVVAVNAIRVERVGLKVTEALYSNPQIGVDVSAPGDDLLSIDNRDQFSFKLRSGSSYAVAFVSGLAVIMKDYNPDLTYLDFQEILKSSSTDYGDEGHDRVYGHGLINITSFISHLEQMR